MDLIAAFFRIGCMAFGGGYVMLPLLQREIVEKRGWITQEELLDCFAIGQCTPGIIAVNAATFVGYRRAGVAGGAFATLGIVLPSLLIIGVLSGVLQAVAAYPVVIHAFAGIRAAVAALVLAAVISLYRKGVKGAAGNAACVGALALAVLGVSPVWIVLAAVALGIVPELIRGRRA